MAEIQIKVSRRPLPAEREEIDPAMAVRGRKPAMPEVEGQCGGDSGWAAQLITCTECFTLNEVNVSPHHYCGYGVCWNCGATLWA